MDLCHPSNYNALVYDCKAGFVVIAMVTCPSTFSEGQALFLYPEDEALTLINILLVLFSTCGQFTTFSPWENTLSALLFLIKNTEAAIAVPSQTSNNMLARIGKAVSSNTERPNAV